LIHLNLTRFGLETVIATSLFETGEAALGCISQ